MTKRHADNETVADIVRLRKENEELQQRIRYQEHRDGAAKGKTHATDCYGYGPSHYECALQKIELLQEDRERLREALQPFADVAEYGDKHCPDMNDSDEISVSVADLRRAFAALKEGK